jgi:hypothetical protein
MSNPVKQEEKIYTRKRLLRRCNAALKASHTKQKWELKKKKREKNEKAKAGFRRRPRLSIAPQESKQNQIINFRSSTLIAL